MLLTSAEKAFLRGQNVSQDDVCDARAFPAKSRKEQAKKLGCNFMIGVECRKAGHRLRTRNNHCIQCDHAKIAYQLRRSNTGYVYIAHSASLKLIKVGYSLDLQERKRSLNASRYGEVKDWCIIYYIKSKYAGQLESNIQKGLEGHQENRKYYKDNHWQSTNELFRCGFKVVKETIDCCLIEEDVLEKKEIDIQFYGKYG